MAEFSITISDDDVGRVITAMCANYGYTENVLNPDFDPSLPEDPDTNPQYIPNPETAYQFANRMTRDYLMNNTVAYELKVEKQNVPKPTPPDITNPHLED
tara:strand:+ start:412 stop:711 length:300 start_codon:yes stop_codon:yes gene_type:complete